MPKTLKVYRTRAVHCQTDPWPSPNQGISILTLKPLLSWLPVLSGQIWLLAGGRLLSQLGTGFTLFYAPIFFVQQVGLSATEVGLALGSGSLAGVLGRFLSGVLCDSPQAGRRSALLLSAAIAAIADIFLATAANLPGLVLGNLCMGLGIGLYWPATETVVADLTQPEQRSEAFAVTRVSDSVGLGLGVILAGLWLQWTQNYHLLFVVDGISFVIFLGLVFLFIKETRPDRSPQSLDASRSTQPDRSPLDSIDRSTGPVPRLQEIPQTRSGFRLWPSLRSSLRTSLDPLIHDRALQVFLGANILFTTYLSQIQSTLPLYLSQGQDSTTGTPWFSAAVISRLFAWHVVLTAVLQLPVARGLKTWGHVGSLRLSAGLWALAFVGVGLLGRAMAQTTELAAIGVVPLAFGLLALLAMAVVSYLPAAAALVVNLAPPAQRGTYLALSSQCWAVGYFLGPPLGGYALDQGVAIAQGFWWGLAGSVLGLQFALQWLAQRSQAQGQKHGNSRSESP